MRIYAWNVNGIRAAAKNGFLDWLAVAKPDILCISEFRATPEQVPPEVLAPKGYRSYVVCGEKKGYSGVAIYARKEPDAVVYGLGDPKFDVEGRVIQASWGDLCVISTYYPNTGGGPLRVEYKVAFCAAMQAHVVKLVAEGKHVVLNGDLNIAHRPIDLARPKENEKNPGYLPEERAALDALLGAGFVDTFRAKHPDLVKYSWWDMKSRARDRNIGWRIDYHIVDEGLRTRIKDASIHDDVMGSDHCPVELVLKD